MKVGYLNFSNKPSPKAIGNPLPNHVEPKINAITEELDHRVKIGVGEVKIQMMMVYDGLVKAEILMPKRK